MKTFTLEEAEALLFSLRALLVEMREQKREIDRLRAELGDVSGRAGGNGHVKPAEGADEKRRRAESLVERLNARLATFHELGIELKSVDDGLIDFPSEREGRIVYLCLRLGEERIAWWHETWAGFAGRQPL